MKNDVASTLCERIIAQLPEAVIVADRNGRIQLWNRGAEAMFGYPAAETLGKSLDLIIPDDLRQRHWEGYHRAVSAGHVRSGDRATPTKAVRRDGTTIYVELSFAIVLGETGTVVGAVAVGRNITERYLRDRSLRRRLAALEQEVAAHAPHSGSGDASE